MKKRKENVINFFKLRGSNLDKKKNKCILHYCKDTKKVIKNLIKIITKKVVYGSPFEFFKNHKKNAFEFPIRKNCKFSIRLQIP